VDKWRPCLFADQPGKGLNTARPSYGVFRSVESVFGIQEYQQPIAQPKPAIRLCNRLCRPNSTTTALTTGLFRRSTSDCPGCYSHRQCGLPCPGCQATRLPWPSYKPARPGYPLRLGNLETCV